MQMSCKFHILVALSRHSFGRRLGDPQSWFGRDGEEKIAAPSENRTQLPVYII